VNLKNDYEIENDVVKIILKDRENIERCCLIDSSNLYKLEKYSGTFFASYRKKVDNFYCCLSLYLGMQNRKPKYKTIYISKILLEIEDDKSLYIDHINHNTLDNRIENLRVINNSDNSKNRKSKNSNNTSGYRNVSWINGHWRVQLQINGKNNLFKEKFDNAKDAGEFANNMRQIHYGQFAGKDE
jgi:hypothetical protein